MIPSIAITPGEPAGIGPDLCIQYVQTLRAEGPELVVVADPQLMQQRARQLGLPLSLREFSPGNPTRAKVRELAIVPVSLAQPCETGHLNAANARYVLATLERAVSGCQRGDFSAMVTGPVQKSVINEAGIGFTGHTEFLAALCGRETVVMMLATRGLRVALATTHLPLLQVPAAITRPLLRRIIRILEADLKNRFGIARPRILVSGLNPHAGEGGHLGREEIDTIIPVLEECRAAGMQVLGPLPADTLFTDKYLQDADAVLAMYHDQGLPVLKYKGFGQAVNITLGLPIIRTSVDHGTALDLAGSGQANCGSLATAIDYAVQMAAHSQRTEQ